MAEGIQYAVDQGADVINVSLGFPCRSKVVEWAVDYAFHHRVPLIGSVGNYDVESTDYPAGFSHAIAVAAVDDNDVKAGFSNYEGKVDVVTPGAAVYSTYSNGMFAWWSGTSQAAPLVTGAAALVLGISPNLPVGGVRETIVGTATNIDALNPGYIGKLGSGRVDMLAAVTSLVDGTPTTIDPEPTATTADPEPTPTSAPNSSVSLYVVDNVAHAVFEYADDGTYLGSVPLDGQNVAPHGVATDGVNFWTTDIMADHAYKYTPDGALTTTWPQFVDNDGGTGLTTDGTNIWVVDGTDAKVYMYDMNGSFASQFSLFGKNKSASGITTNGVNIWVVDVGGDKVFKYTMSGKSKGGFALAPGNNHAQGITTDGVNFWVVDWADDTIYRYDMSGGFISSFALAADNSGPKGITVNQK